MINIKQCNFYDIIGNKIKSTAWSRDFDNRGGPEKYERH